MVVGLTAASSRQDHHRAADGARRLSLLRVESIEYAVGVRRLRTILASLRKLHVAAGRLGPELRKAIEICPQPALVKCECPGQLNNVRLLPGSMVVPELPDVRAEIRRLWEEADSVSTRWGHR